MKTPFRDFFINTPGGLKIRTIAFNEKISGRTPLVVLHGFAAGIGLWCLNLDAFASKTPVYALDWIGKI